ncbi:AB-hydrolase YheT [Dendrothele bispora CBS 962.96]|uniref:AB-hydrolase YheT n=1 Tax=Dendrothele bispora (strain CBS 962.96) TaxID=1314807 RepID=A0A4S8MDH3_DENBC|nr:AB-hydrolase YheT [Dendrothele bispora CBS 962.96]
MCLLSYFSFFTSPSSPEVYYPLKPADVLLKKREDNQEKSPFTERKDRKSLRSILEERCPSLFEGYSTPWWLFNGHMQTLYSILGGFLKSDVVIYHRTYLRLVDGGTLGLDFTPVEQSSLPDETPIIVVTHGLTGGSHEGYVRAVLGRACTPVERGGLGYRAVVVNSRGCAGVPITSQQLYSAGYTDDLRIALMYISHQYPNAPLLGLGFSLGANIMVRYLAEEEEKSRLSAVCSLACPWDMLKNGLAINSTFLGRNLYARGMGISFYKLLKRNAAVLSGKTVVSPPSFLVIAEAVSTTLKLRFPGLDDFDDAFTRIAGGVPQDLNFSSYQEYYAWASSHHVLKDVRRPLLAINAADDPVIRFVPKTEQEVGNPWTTVVITPGGGHLGWFSPAPSSHKYSMTAGLMETSRWTTKPVLEWLDMAGNDFDIKVNASDLYICDEGFLREFGRAALGCMEVEGGGIIDWSSTELTNEMI